MHASRVATLAAFSVIGAGCSHLTLPTSASLNSSAHTTATNSDLCAVDRQHALNCARYLRDAFAQLETGVGRGEEAYGYLSVALGALTAIYLKSSEDRSQAIEDLAVGVATLAGFRAVYNPRERLRIATEGRRAVECMIQTVEGIEELKKEVNSQPPNAQQQVKSVVDLHGAVDRHFGLSAIQAQQRNPRQPQLNAFQAQQLTQGVLISQRINEFSLANSATRVAVQAAADDKVVAARLSFGLHQVLNNARLAITNASLPVDNLVVSQRDSVQAMMGTLARRIEEEQQEADRTVGAAGTTNDPASNAAAAAAAGESESPARVYLQGVYERCVPDEGS